MRKFHVWALVLCICGALCSSVCAWAQKNPFSVIRQSGKIAASVERKILQSLRPALNPAGRLPSAAGRTLSRVEIPGISPSVSPAVPSFSVPSATAPKIPSAALSVPSTAVLPDALRVRSVFPGKAQLDAVIFDLDGTLLDSLSAWEHSGTNFLRTQGIHPPDGLDEVLVKMSLSDGARLLKEQFSLPQSSEEILRLTLEPVRRHYFEDIAAKPGVPETLRYLKSQGVKLCVATASDRELAEAALARLGLLDTFDFILTCDEVGVGKRSPAVYEEALRRLGTDKSRTLVAEDARYALETAKNAGFMTAGVADAHTPAADAEKIREAADYYVESFLGGVLKK